MAGRAGHRGFGTARKLASGRYQASYRGPDEARHNGPHTFKAKVDAEAWLAAEQLLVAAGTWTPPKRRRADAEAALAAEAARIVTFRTYADTWLKHRTLKPRTREHYAALLKNQLNPTFGDLPVESINPFTVKAWYAEMDTRTPSLRAHAYGLLRTILGDTVRDGLVPSNPCHIRGAGATKRVHKIKPASVAELGTIVGAMPERYRLMVLLAGWCGLRFGELTELRRQDIDVKEGLIRVRRGVVRVGGEFVVGPPKSDAGVRDVAIPPHLLPVVREHLASTITGGRDGLLFPASDGVTHMAPATLYKVFYPARAKAGRPDLRFHDLRHTGAVLAASTGATLAELMGRLGHSTPGAAMRYQHVAEGRDQAIAKALSALATMST
jgi:integrase